MWPEQSILDGIASMSAQLAQQQEAWGQQQFAQNSNLTDQVVGNYLTSFGQLSGWANNAMSQYENMFVPEMNQLVQDANDYNSPSREQFNMGQAESQAGQAFDQQRQAALQDLQSFGVDPSSGRYASLDRAERAQEAASMAGAGNQAMLQTQAVGRGLRSEAIQVGERLPGEAVSELSAGMQALAGGENAQLANSKLGLDMLGSPSQWAQIASSLKYPPTTGSTSGGQVRPQSNDNSSSGNRAPPNVNVPADKTIGSGNQGGGGGDSLYGKGGGPGGGNSGSGGGAGYNPSSALSSVDNPNGPTPEYGPENQYGPTIDDYNPDNDSNFGGNQGTDIYNQNNTGGIDNSFGDFNSTDDYSNYDTSSSNDSYNPDSDSNFGDNSGGNDFSSQGDDNSYGDFSDSSADEDSFAEGGVIPVSASPSRGAKTDDIPAVVNDSGKQIRVNADEFIVPKDVARWKGEEYFQKMIDDARKARAKGSAKPSMKPALDMD